MKLAKKHKVNYMFEASCGGGIPIIRALNSSLTADEIDQISGILNGTTNFILTEMAESGADFDQVLKDAQNKGYAERNPEADVEGYDACRKIAILSSLAYGAHVDYRDVYTEGITKITAEDMKYAKMLGMSIKLLADSKREGERFSAMVCPTMVGKGSPLYSVNGVFNAVFVHGNVLGRRNVLRQRRRKAANSQCCSGRHCRLCQTSWKNSYDELEQQGTGTGGY